MLITILATLHTGSRRGGVRSVAVLAVVSFRMDGFLKGSVQTGEMALDVVEAGEAGILG